MYMKRAMKHFVYFALVVCLSMSLSAHARHLDHLQSHIVINNDGSVVITEKIQLTETTLAENVGPIERRLPTNYMSAFTGLFNARIKVLAVEFDGQPTPYTIKRSSDYVSVYIGALGAIIRPGKHQYLLRYQVKNSIQVDKQSDYFYWIANGRFALDTYGYVTVTVTIPKNTKLKKAVITAGRTILPQNEPTTPSVNKNGDLEFKTKFPFGHYRPVGINIWLPTGVIIRPEEQRSRLINWLMRPHHLIFAIGYLILLIYYLITWYVVGVDPRKGQIQISNTPPPGISPAAIHFLNHMGFSIYDGQARAFAATIVDLAIKGHIRIYKDHEIFYLKLEDSNTENLYPTEKVILKSLFSVTTLIAIKGANWEIIHNAMAQLRHRLENEYLDVYFICNSQHFSVGIILSVLTIFLWIWRYPGDPLDNYHTIFILSLLLFLNGLFYYLLKTPTIIGRSIMDKIEGFKQYLIYPDGFKESAEGSPVIDRQQFEKCYPYAIAIGISTPWTKHFLTAQKGKSEADVYYPQFYKNCNPFDGSLVQQNSKLTIDVINHDLSHNLIRAISLSLGDTGTSSE